METSPHRAAREKRASWGQYLDVFPALPMRRVKSPATHSRHCSIQSDTTLIGDEEQEKETEFLSKTNTKVAGCSFMVRRWIRNVKGSYLHPYPREEAPYTISYNRISLNMCVQSSLMLRDTDIVIRDMRLHELLDKLNSKASPTFCDLISRPPIRVLDLGCGEGYWVVGAAEHWRKHGTEVIGFDLLELASNMWEVPAYADGMQPIFSWKQGNL
jgi:2-polyprenyl-3-methyl-5-hydroxy-6-metoxy-1,4-benzoquinol methylase